MRKKLSILCGFLLLFFHIALAQKVDIYGKVTDENGNALPGASVIEKGTNNGTTTSSDGAYKLSVKKNAILQITSVGFEMYEASVKGNEINVKLVPVGRIMNEVVVTALGFQTKKDKLTTSQSTVKGAAVVKSGETSVLQGLASKASGVQVIRSGGDPGAGAYVQIRGQSTITGNIQPLIVIDGVPMFNSNFGQGVAGVVQQSRLSDINPNDIASMEILKSTAAAALWGTAAANGAILITTKKGKSGKKINISFSSSFSLDQINKSVPLQTVFGQGNSGRFIFGNRASWGDKIANRAGGEDVAASADYVILPDGSRRYRIASGTASNPSGGKRSRNVYDHSKELFRTGYFYDNNIAFSGGDEKSTFYASIANLTQKGILKAGSDYNRWSFRFNGDRKFGNNVKLSAGFNYSNVASNRVQQGSNLSGIFLGGLRTSPDYDNTFFEGTYVNASGAQFPNRQVAYRNPIGANTNSVYDNPFWIINRIKSTSNVDRLLTNFELSINITPDLSLINRAGIDYYTDGQTDFFPSLASTIPGGQYTNQAISERQFNNQLLLKYAKELSSKFDISVILGHNYNSQYFSNIGATVNNFILPNAPANLGNSPTTSRVPFNSFVRSRKSGILGQVDLSYNEMLNLQLTARNEIASQYSGNFFFPTASLSWIFTKLPAFSSSKAISFGKIRTSWGQIGVEPGAYLTQTYFGPLTASEGWGPVLSASSGVYGGGFSRSSLQGNPGIKPEIKQEVEVGADLRFVKDRISLSATYYQNKTKDAIFPTEVPQSTGFDNQWTNAGELENKGWEVDLGFDWLRKKNLSVSSNIIWSRNRNKVLSLAGVKSVFLNGFIGSDSRAVVGYPIGVLWGEDWERDNKGAIVLNSLGFPNGKSSESMVIGDPNPNWTGAISTTLRWKNFSFNFLLDHVNGGDVWNGTRGALYTFGTQADMGAEATATTPLRTILGATIPAGTTFRGYIKDWGAGPVAMEEAWFGANRTQDVGLGNGFNGPASQFIEDGTRTRLREVGLGYVINGEKFTRKSKLQSIEISITGRNLFLWTNYTGIDPETNLTGPSNGRGLDYFNNPSTRSFLFTIRVNY
ncbi:MAG: SusC/RagA family TonB-linked outer membrane protein [Chitinophagaceae bacterium]|nr:SusC/RagA family TonB-linked outer membrane protein [Chitinophagaceae bacterium]